MKSRLFLRFYLPAAMLLGGVIGLGLAITGTPDWIGLLTMGLSISLGAGPAQRQLVKPKRPQDQWLQR